MVRGAWFVEKVIADPADKQNPMLDLVGKADLSNLPDATVITAEIDPLMSEGRTLARNCARRAPRSSTRTTRARPTSSSAWRRW
jgi:acetyl esterase